VYLNIGLFFIVKADLNLLVGGRENGSKNQVPRLLAGVAAAGSGAAAAGSGASAIRSVPSVRSLIGESALGCLAASDGASGGRGGEKKPRRLVCSKTKFGSISGASSLSVIPGRGPVTWMGSIPPVSRKSVNCSPVRGSCLRDLIDVAGDPVYGLRWVISRERDSPSPLGPSGQLGYGITRVNRFGAGTRLTGLAIFYIIYILIKMSTKQIVISEQHQRVYLGEGHRFRSIKVLNLRFDNPYTGSDTMQIGLRNGLDQNDMILADGTLVKYFYNFPLIDATVTNCQHHDGNIRQYYERSGKTVTHFDIDLCLDGVPLAVGAMTDSKLIYLELYFE